MSLDIKDLPDQHVNDATVTKIVRKEGNSRVTGKANQPNI